MLLVGLVMFVIPYICFAILVFFTAWCASSLLNSIFN